MRRELRAGLVLVIAGTLGAGCKQQLPVAPPPLARQEVWSMVNQRAQTLKTLKAKLSMKVKMAEMKNEESVGALFAASGPASLRLRGQHELLNYPPFDIGSNGKTWWVHVHIQELDRVDYGEVADLQKQYDPDVPVRPDQIVAALGMAPVANTGNRYWLFLKPPGAYVLQEVATDAREPYVVTQITLDPQTTLIRKYETLLENGRVDMSASLEDYKAVNQVLVAHKITIYMWKDSKLSMLEMTLHDVQVNATLPDVQFRPPNFEEIPERIQHPKGAGQALLP